MPNVVTPAEMDRYLSVAEFAKRQCVTKAVVWKWVRENDFPHIRLGRRIMIPPDAMTRLITTQAASTDLSTKTPQRARTLRNSR